MNRAEQSNEQPVEEQETTEPVAAPEGAASADEATPTEVEANAADAADAEAAPAPDPTGPFADEASDEARSLADELERDIEAALGFAAQIAAGDPTTFSATPTEGDADAAPVDCFDFDDLSAELGGIEDPVAPAAEEAAAPPDEAPTSAVGDWLDDDVEADTTPAAAPPQPAAMTPDELFEKAAAEQVMELTAEPEPVATEPTPTGETTMHDEPSNDLEQPEPDPWFGADAEPAAAAEPEELDVPPTPTADDADEPTETAIEHEADVEAESAANADAEAPPAADEPVAEDAPPPADEPEPAAEPEPEAASDEASAPPEADTPEPDTDGEEPHEEPEPQAAQEPEPEPEPDPDEPGTDAPAPGAVAAADADEEFALTSRSMDKVQEFLGELKGVLVELAQRPQPTQQVDVAPLVEAVQQGFERSAGQTTEATTALSALSERVDRIGERVESGMRGSFASLQEQLASTAARPAAAVPFITTRSRQPLVLGAIGFLVLGWSVLFWFKTGSPKLALGTLVGANLLGCCALLARRDAS